MFLSVRIRDYERGLYFRNGNFTRVLTPGRTWFPLRLIFWRRDRVEIFNALSARFEHVLLESIARNQSARAEITFVELAQNQRAIVWKDGRLIAMLGPGTSPHAFWKTAAKIEVEVFDINTVRFEHEQLEAILAAPNASTFLEGVIVEAHETVLLFKNGQLVDRLNEGRYVFWRGAGKIAWRAVDLREQVADVAGQEIMTSDKVTLRVNLVVAYKVVDAVKAATIVSDYAQALYREAQLALRAAIGTRTLDALLTDKESISGEVKNALAPRAAEFGVNVRSVGLRDIILPGDMKLILNQVITAEKEAQANLIRRREETAAARSQANTAKLLAENPALARMKELEALQAILSGAKTSFVFGAGDLSAQIRKLITDEQAN